MTGSGTAADPYKIYDVNDLQAMENDLAAYYELANDIDASATVGWNGGAGFAPIGATWDVGFSGSFDGKGFTIDGLTINRGATDGVGLFGYTSWGTNAIIKNVHLVNVSVVGGDYTGALLGQGYHADIDNCSSGGEVTGGDDTGGLIGYAYHSSHIANSHSSCSIIATKGGGGFAGSLLGDCIIENCYATGNVTASADGFSSIGGFVGGAGSGGPDTTVINRCYAAGNVEVTTDSIRNVYAGGFVGSSGNSITNCYACGDVTTVIFESGSYASYAGGFVGMVAGYTIDKCYSTGIPIAQNVGGFCAWLIVAQGATITNCFWDTETSGQAASDGGTGKTTAQMKTESTFTDVGWDFTTPIWYINATINDGYPAFIGGVTRIKGNPNIDQRMFQHVERMGR